MIEQPYPYYALKEKTQYIFMSVGEKNVMKIVFITPLRDNIWNLGFGDIIGEDWVDNIISDNKDMRKILQTVANAEYLHRL